MLLWAGTDKEIRELAGSATKTTDASGGTITSGPDRAGEGAGAERAIGDRSVWDRPMDYHQRTSSSGAECQDSYRISWYD